ncbi:hypothetical protein CLAFUW4_01853 [Fulvia fulva]|uniref:Uncharacterized protein n=1 Tax=Passalora fulva TaxID=5499 RepID=A0A9Q8P299_PASFU|nr:uncharacterized protein CLAFUR5_01848 [Fulvia fulva]KAK4634586.1 hypothetical protein CLAFUR4_01848 [Fulvia fulva]KAK4636812.1 hypothetical protein CLAFUR0_01850 [Fulvia fulva]UJO10755.1 hypothetical protein CLAFUR5_01848 [Fulvia fulva]WPV08775.1 hypothetical protein CLAFUW4_01853 [Fulvia fulva]WPV24099.1 hypothetical protein CLAFUW7_01852 [Fulvia fulva]
MSTDCEPSVRDFGRPNVTFDGGVSLRPGQKSLPVDLRHCSTLNVDRLPSRRSSLELGGPIEAAATSYYNGPPDDRAEETPSIVASTTSRDASPSPQNPERRLTRQKSTIQSVNSTRTLYKLKNIRMFSSPLRR